MEIRGIVLGRTRLGTQGRNLDRPR
jgi:hypothetical protein